VGSCRTPNDGECTFVPPRPDIYIARIKQSGYQEVWGRMDLTITNHGYVSLELRPSDDAPPGNSKDASGATVSAADLAVPNDARQEFEKGQKLLIDKNAGASIPHFRKAIQLYAAFPQAYTLLGTAYLQQNNWKDARPALEKATQLDPKSAGAYLQLGATYNQMKDYPEAEKALTRGLELSPNAAAGHYEIAKTYWAVGRWEDAEPHAAKAVDGMPDVAPVHVLMGNILLRKKDGPGALREFQEYLRLDPNGSMAPSVRDIVAKIQKALAAQ
jgi:tetratricopeptide (TPR) repeat protein